MLPLLNSPLSELQIKKCYKQSSFYILFIIAFEVNKYQVFLQLANKKPKENTDNYFVILRIYLSNGEMSCKFYLNVRISASKHQQH